MSQEKIIEVKNLSKKFGSFTAVDDISFDVYKGEIFGFLGANGAGKSTTIGLITTLIKKTSGDIVINGYNLDNYPEKAKFSLFGRFINFAKNRKSEKSFTK